MYSNIRFLLVEILWSGHTTTNCFNFEYVLVVYLEFLWIIKWQIILRGRDFFSFFNIKDIIKKRCAEKKISAS